MTRFAAIPDKDMLRHRQAGGQAAIRKRDEPRPSETFDWDTAIARTRDILDKLYR